MHIAVRGDSISKIVGTSNPKAVEAFMRANGLKDSKLIAGQGYRMPDADDYAASDGRIGQADHHELGQAERDVDFHMHRACVDAEDRRGAQAGEHARARVQAAGHAGHRRAFNGLGA